MPGIELKDGRILRSEVELPPEVWDTVAAGVEKGGTPPKGFTVSGEVKQTPEQAGVGKTAGERFQEMGQGVNRAVQTAREYVGPTLESVRGKATRGVSVGLGAMQAAPAMMQHLAGEPTVQEAGENATNIARRVVPQTASELLTTLALGATSKIPGMGGVIARLASTAGGDMAGKYLAGEEQNLGETALKTGVTGATELVGAVVPQFSKIIRDKQKEALGRQDAAALGEAFAKHTSFQTLNTPENISNFLSGSKFINTPISKSVSATMDANEKQLLGQVRQAMGSAPPQNLLAAKTMLEEAADVAPKNTVAVGFRGSNSPVIQQQNTHDQLVEMGINRLRHIREEINHSIDAAGTTGTLGVSTFDLFQKYDQIKNTLLSGLATMDPALRDSYNQMNAQYIKDFDLAKFLYKGRDEILTSGKHSAVLSTPGLGDYVTRVVEDIRDKNLVADILKVTTRGGAFGAADQSWSLRPIVRGPKTGGSTIGEAINIMGLTPASRRITRENMPPMGVYDIGALKGLELAQPEEKRK